MGILSIFKKSRAGTSFVRPVSGSFTLDSQGNVRSSTMAHDFPDAAVQEIGAQVRNAFRRAEEAQLPMNEMAVHYETLRITARRIGEGFMVFVAPQRPGFRHGASSKVDSPNQEGDKANLEQQL